MIGNMIKKIFFIACIFIGDHSYAQEKKLIGLVAIKNEQNCIEQCLHALSLYTDAIIVLDDVSTDRTNTILTECKEKYNLFIITKTIWHRDEAKDRNLMLKCGRIIHGTHFIIIDADELLSAPCLTNNYLRTKILNLTPNEWLSCSLIDLYESAEKYNADIPLKGIAFCDNQIAYFDEDCKIHAKRIPETINGKEHIVQFQNRYGLLHFKYSNWENVVIRNTWYQCLIAILWPNIPRKKLGFFYKQKLLQQKGILNPSCTCWFDYPFFTLSDYIQPDHWRIQQIHEWFNVHGYDYFKDLNLPITSLTV